MKKTPNKQLKAFNLQTAFIVKIFKKYIQKFNHEKTRKHIKDTPLNIHTILIGIGILGLLGAIHMIFATNRIVPEIAPLVAPPVPIFDHYIAASGIIEGSSDNIKVGAHQGGIVHDIFIHVGQSVKKGEKLFTLDSQNAVAELDIYPAQHKEAEALLQQAQAVLNSTKGKYDISKQVKDLRAISKEERLLRKNAYLSDKAAFDKATGAVDAAKAKRNRAEIQLNQMTILAPEDTTILKINIHKGEFATAHKDNGHILLGQTEKMQIRLDIDEAEAWRYKKGSKAKAYLRGNSTIAFDLDFDHVEPFILPKTSLTSKNTEKVDTRVLQVVYTFKTSAQNVYVGQQVDVIIEDAQYNQGAA